MEATLDGAAGGTAGNAEKRDANMPETSGARKIPMTSRAGGPSRRTNEDRRIPGTATRRSGVAAAAGLAALLLAACELHTGPDLFRHDLRGDFDGFFTLEWEPVDFGRGGWVDGHGSIHIHRGHRSSFEGDWVWRLDGRRFRGDLERGREEFGDEVSFRLESRFGHDLLEEVTGCFFLRGDRFFYGFARHGRLVASRTARLRCHDAFGFDDDIVVRLTFEGWR